MQARPKPWDELIDHFKDSGHKYENNLVQITYCVDLTGIGTDYSLEAVGIDIRHTRGSI